MLCYFLDNISIENFYINEEETQLTRGISFWLMQPQLRCSFWIWKADDQALKKENLRMWPVWLQLRFLLKFHFYSFHPN